ncbi:N-acetylmuramoyl-L-alanine amidase [Actinophytocola xanthii]|uniref:N-acetylmuramoyl-L-alanine amidase n=1 Tax=Actinophytocola xanthii TaxID=1912961 RepID=A0A1Q8CNI2_9PSEU|nr:N-acetylmuramoyl-L-alanine amidase [Actinophytocola xanthii]
MLALAGCAAPAPPVSLSSPPPSVPSATRPSVPSSAPSSAPPSSTSTAPPAVAPVVVPVVVLDPGHNGGNAGAPEVINRPVPAGRGRTKPCNTTSTATDAGFPEHVFTWSVALLVRDALTARGVRVVLTRPDDDGVGPCVNERAAVGNRARAAAVVSIHADGSIDPGARGFHVAYSAPPLNPAQGAPTLRLAEAMRDALRASFPVSTYIGRDGLSPRNDLGGLNLSQRPAVLVECGNMRNPDEAAAFASESGRRAYATAIAAGILAYLG